MWRILRHPNVMPLLGVTMTENPRRFVVVSEWMEDMNVKQFLQCVHVDRLKLQVVCVLGPPCLRSILTIIVARRRYQGADPYA